MKTYSAKPGDIDRRWYVADASTEPLGRLATRVATVLRGKHKPMFTPHMDVGDFVVVVNAEKLVLTGQKMDKKEYQNYSGYSGGRSTRTAAEQLAVDPREMVRRAVWGMLPKGRLGRQLIQKLKIYAGSEHPHRAQKPQALPK
ncbi:MAG TPA: 50S ribosomal protein L13 [Candidatus Krumholzibacteria bacterium]